MAALGVCAIGAVTFSAPASAAPFLLFPFAASPAPSAPLVQATPGPNDQTPFELPARFRRPVLRYPAPEAPGPIIIDTPHTYLYYVLGGGQAIRYGIGVGREGFTSAGVQSVTKIGEC